MARNEDGYINQEAELLVHTINLCTANCDVTDAILSHPQYKRFSALTNRICHQLREFQRTKVRMCNTSTWNLICE